MKSSGKDLGRNIRAMRLKHRFSLNNLAQATGISASNLSAMEHGKSSPTLNTLAKIAAAFKMKAGAFLDEALYSKAVLCRNGEGREMASAVTDVSIRLLTGDAYANRMEVVTLVLQPGCEPMSPLVTAMDRFIYCLAGEVTVKVADDTYAVKERDALYLLPEADVELSNETSEIVSVLLVALKTG
ncbi:MAG: helix-turn-helix transcriptional regulator [Desulfomonile tiedjei]|nr:helix-turn-helix transcriptional regulator [Desulfomonile tiedjei]